MAGVAMMVRDKYAVRLAQEQREELQRLIRVGKNSARVTARARILLKSDDGWAAPQVAEALDVALSTVYRVKQRFAEEGLERVLQDRPQANRPRKLDDRGEAHLIALACSPPPEGHDQEVAVTERRTMQDFARRMRWLADEAYPEAEVVRVVLDNLNTHRRASLYETSPAEEARRIARRLEFHYTPKHGSWLNMAEIEFSVLSRSCLKQRLSGEEALRREVDALVKERNAARATINWRFNTRDARTKLRRLYHSDFTVD